MSYTVLARRYRSTSFGQVIGQDMVAQALRNAIATHRVAHAYLFTGTRGVGKTSMARILARALNAPDTIEDCPKPDDDHEYPPRDVQDRIAEAVMRGDDLNVIEIDGASNNSVDQARQLIANASLSPTGNARFKIYIIDEVHMLSGAAFNALLKTMEEPPSHVKFILCTTEPHKVPATIQSRCQRFDFRQIPTARIVDHLRDVLQRESIRAEDRVIWEVARLGNGSMRDALSLLDRLIAGCAGEAESQTITVDLLERVLGLPPQEVVIRLIQAFADGDVGLSLNQTAAALESGISQDQLLEVIIEWLRQLMLITACGKDSELVELSDEMRKVAAQQSESFDPSGLVYMIALCDNLQRGSKSSSTPRALLDATVVRLALAEKMADVTGLLRGDDPRKKKDSMNPTPVRPPGPDRPHAQTSPPFPQIPRPDSKPQAVPVTHPVTSPPPATSIDMTQPGSIWKALLAKVGEQRSLAWVGNLTLRHLDRGTAHIDTLPGCGDLKGFVNEDRCQQLATLLTPIVGGPVKVLFDAERGTRSDTQPTPGGGAALGHGALSQSRYADAMNLPMVKELLSVFDATVVDVRPIDEPKQSGDTHGT